MLYVKKKILANLFVKCVRLSIFEVAWSCISLIIGRCGCCIVLTNMCNIDQF